MKLYSPGNEKITLMHGEQGYAICRIESPVLSSRGIDGVLAIEISDGTWRFIFEPDLANVDEGWSNIQKALVAGYDHVLSLGVSSAVSERTERQAASAGLPFDKVTFATPVIFQPNAKEYLARFIELPGPEKLLLLDILDHPSSTFASRETRLASDGVPLIRAREALENSIHAELLSGENDKLALSRAMLDAFRSIGALSN